MLLLFSCLTSFSVRPSVAFPPGRWVERAAPIWRHQGQSNCNSHPIFQWKRSTRVRGQSNPYEESAEGCLWVTASSVIPKKNYICPTANDCIFIAISASPFILSSPFPIPLRIFKGLPYSWAPCTRAWGVLCVRKGKRYKVYHARVSCIVKSSPLNT